MCGIWAIFGSEQDDVPNQCKAAYEIKHRGPDAFRLETIHFFPNCAIGFHRLAIVDDLEGMQPMRMLRYPHIWLMYNGEIYNHKLLEEEFGFDMATECDGEVIIHLYVKGGVKFAAKHLDGVFAFLILDTAERRVYVGRDTFGVRPAFKSYIEKEGFLAVCSEAKGLIHLQQINSNVRITPVSPGHVETYSLDLNGKASHENTVCFHRIGQLPAYTTSVNPVENDIEESIRMLLDASVCKRTMAERRIGCLLSGGLASSLVAALFVRKAKRIGIKYPIQTFSIGIKGSQDLLDARKIANHLGTEHHEVHMTPDEIISSLKSIIYHLESYDSRTIQASVGLYLLSKYINEKTDTRVILSGEGAEEVLQSYSSSDDNTENLRLCRDLYMYGGLRADRCTAAWGLEIRDPFLDHRFSSYYISLAPEHKQPADSLLRAAFDNTDLLPKPFPINKKRSYGISSVQQILQEHPHVFEVSENELEKASSRYPYNTPCSKEALFFRNVFESFYPERAEWIPDSATTDELTEWSKKDVDSNRKQVMEMFPSVLTYIVGKKDDTPTVKVFLRDDDSSAKDYFHRVFDKHFIDDVNIKKKLEEKLGQPEPYRREQQMDKDVKKRLSDVIKRQGRTLLTNHSTIIRISVGNMPEGILVGNPCIVLHCLDKTLIPIGEEELPSQVEEFPVYIKESFIMFGVCDGCNRLKHGCSIGTTLEESAGSIGFFVKIRKPGQLEEERGFLTAAHVALPNFPDFYGRNRLFSEHNLGNRIYEIVHPSMIDSTSVIPIGRVSEAFCGTYGQTNSGIDAAFVNTYEENLEHYNLQIAQEEDITFDGATKVTKTGRTTSTTEGRLAQQVEFIRIQNRAGEFCQFENVYCIQNLGPSEPPFFKPGDSGSGVYLIQEKCKKALGIAFAYDIEEVETLVCSMKEIVNAFHIIY